MQLLEAGDLNGAIADFSRAIEIEPNRAAAHRLRGSAHLRKRAFDKAKTDLDSAISLSPKDAVACYLRGRARHLRDRDGQ
jgi:Flp pilus assembly protein TadD